MNSHLNVFSMHSRENHIERILHLHNDKHIPQDYDSTNVILDIVINSLSEGIIVADTQGNFVFFNHAAEDILGIGSKNIDTGDWSSSYGCYYTDKITPFPNELLPLYRAIKFQEQCNETIFIRNSERPNGLFINVSGGPLKNKDDTHIGGIAYFRDITENVVSQIKLMQSEERLKSQFRGFPLPTYVWQKKDDDYFLIDYNHASKIITNRQIHNLLNKKLSEVYPDIPELYDNFNRCYKEQRTFIKQQSIKMKTTNAEKIYNVYFVFVQPDMIMLHTEDITTRKLYEKELDKMLNVVEQTADSVVITDIHGCFEYVNSAFEKTTGFRFSEIKGKTPAILKSGFHDDEFYKGMWTKIQSGESWRGTLRNKKKDGSTYWCEQTITPIKDKDEIITNFVAVIKDITEFKLRQEKEFQLKIASELQRRYNNTCVSLEGYDIFCRTHTANETGGDYYDIINLNDGCLGIVIGDVSGHGIAAALIMSETRAYLRAFAKSESDPAVLISKINNELVNDLQVGYFVTLLIARLNYKDNLIDYVSAGHESAYMMDSDGNTIKVLESNGIPLGIKENFNYKTSEQIKVEPGNLILFFTDGIPDSPINKQTRFGYDNIIGLVKENRKKTSENILDELFKTVRKNTNGDGLHDDLTGIICKVLH